MCNNKSVINQNKKKGSNIYLRLIRVFNLENQCEIHTGHRQMSIRAKTNRNQLIHKSMEWNIYLLSHFTCIFIPHNSNKQIYCNRNHIKHVNKFYLTSGAT